MSRWRFLDAEHHAVAADNFLDAGWCAYRAAYIYGLRRQSTEVLACADRAEAHWRTAKASAGERALVLCMRGEGYVMSKKYPAAIIALRESLELYKTEDDESRDVAVGLNALAMAEQQAGALEDAERDYREARRIARAIGYVEGIATYTGNLAGLALKRRDWSGAEVMAREALSLSEKVGRLELIALDSERLAEALARQDRKDEALPHARRAVEIYSRLVHPNLAIARKTLVECES